MSKVRTLTAYIDHMGAYRDIHRVFEELVRLLREQGIKSVPQGHAIRWCGLFACAPACSKTLASKFQQHVKFLSRTS
jgi:hypothetical protein